MRGDLDGSGALGEETKEEFDMLFFGEGGPSDACVTIGNAAGFCITIGMKGLPAEKPQPTGAPA